MPVFDVYGILFHFPQDAGARESVEFLLPSEERLGKTWLMDYSAPENKSLMTVLLAV